MAASYQGAGTLGENAVAGTTLLVPYPAGLEAGDIIVLYVGVSSVTLPTNPGGFTSQLSGTSGAGGGSSPSFRVSTKIATGSESGNLSVTTPSVVSKGQMYVLRGVNNTTPIDVAPAAANAYGAVTAYNITTQTTTMVGVILMAFVGANVNTGSYTPPTVPATFNEILDDDTPTPSSAVYYLVWTGSGATGTVNVVRSGAIRGYGGMLAFRPQLFAEITQAAFRFYEDGTESGSTVIDALDTNITRDVTADSNLALRIRLTETSGIAGVSTDDYQLQYSKNGSIYRNIGVGASSLSVIDSYSDSNANNYTNYLCGDVVNFPQAQAQSITGNGATIGTVRFSVSKLGSPTGNAVAKIYAHSGTFGTSSVPTGAALAVSDSFDVSTISTTAALVELSFSGANQIALTNGTNYVVSLEYSGGDASNRLNVGRDTSSPTHGGNQSYRSGGIWAASSGFDNCFFLYDNTSATAPVNGFASASLTDGGATTERLSSPTTIASYAEANQDASITLYSGSSKGQGQAFAGDNITPTSAKFYLRKTGSPTGTAVAKIYSATGSTNNRTPNTLRATSATVDVSTLTTSYQLIEFAFSGASDLVLGSNYIIAVEYNSGDVSNALQVGVDNSSPTAAENSVLQATGGTWSITANDTIFYIYGTKFIAGEISETGLVTDHTLSASKFTEHLYSLTIESTAVADADTLDFRVLAKGAVLGTYSVTPRITVSVPGGTTTPQTQTGKARITVATLKTQTGKSRITATATRTQTGKANIANTAPSVALNTPDASNLGSLTPTVEFTGTDLNGDDVRYNIQIDTVNTFDSLGGGSPTIVDSYVEANSDSIYRLGGGGGANNHALGNSFTGDGSILDSAKFYLSKTLSPTGNAVAEIYAHSGTFGSSSVGTGSPLATSDNFDVSTLTGSLALANFTFTGANRITLTNATKYVAVVHYTGGDTSNYLSFGRDTTSPSHGGNLVAITTGTTWAAVGSYDGIFYIYGGGAGGPLLDKISGTDSGFLNTVTGGDTDPFNSGEKASFTVQAGNALSAGTYYWRVRAIDPSGSNTYGSWATTRSFVASTGTTTTKTQTGIARITITTARGQTGKARITLTVARDQTGKARITATTPRTQTGLSRITLSVARLQTGKSSILKAISRAQTGVSRITAVTSRTQAGVSRITITTSQTQLGKSRITVATSRTVDGKARILQTVLRTQTGVARIQFTRQNTQTGISRITKVVAQTQTGKSRITSTTLSTQTGKSRITNSSARNQTGVSKITAPVLRTQTGLARVTVATLKTQTGKARITSTTLQTQTGKGRIQVAVLRNQTGSARVTKVVARTQTGTARIANIVQNVQTGKSRIEKAVQATQTGLGRVVTTNTASNTGKARITAQTARTQLGLARILVDVLTDRTQTGVARITVTTLRNQTGIARLTLSGVQLQTGKARITAIVLQVQTGKARITTTAAQNQTGWARISIVTAQDILGRAKITAVTQRTQTGKARITAIVNRDQTGKARITATAQRTQTGVARIQYVTPRAQTGVARITAATSRTQTGLARIEVIVSRNQTGLSKITAAISRNITGIARITASTTKTQTGKARIEVTTSRIQTGKARVTQTVQQAQTGKARIQFTRTAPQTGIARITATVLTTQTGKARITVVVPRTQTGKARIVQIVNQTITGRARITTTVLQTQTGRASIFKTVTRDQTGISRITYSQNKNQAGVARITVTVSSTQTGVSRVTASTTRNQTGIARVLNGAIKNQTGVARITASAARTQTGVSRITATVLRTITGVARITTTVTKTQTGVARIVKTVTRDQLGLSRITAVVSRTITGKARITAATVRTQTGIANIVVLTTRTITGISKISVQVGQTITGRTSIGVTTQKNQTGVARIILGYDFSPPTIPNLREEKPRMAGVDLDLVRMEL